MGDYVHFYIERKRLAALGYTSSMDDLDCYTASCLLLVSQELDKLESEDMKKKSKGSKHRGR
jgi:hypothetical protein